MNEDSTVIGRLQVLIEAQTSQFRREIERVQSQVRNATNGVNREVDRIKQIFKSLGKAVVTIGIGKTIVNSVRSAMKVESAIQQITRTMQESTNQFLKWAENNALAFNMSKRDALNFGAVYSNLVSSFAKDSKQITDYTTDLLKASSIIASGTGRTMKDVMERIRSGLLGNTEAIEDLGINVNVAMLESTDAFKRFANGKSWNQLSFQTQQQIRLFGILEQTSSKFGGAVFNNTNSSLQQLVAILKDVALNIGNAFLPIVNVVLPVLSNFAMGLRTVTGYIATFMRTLFGYNVSTNKGATGQVNSLNKATSNVGSNAKKTKKEVDKLLGGFDEVNKLGSTSGEEDNSSVGAMSPMGGVGNVDLTPTVDTSVMEEVVAKFKDIFAPAIESFEGLKQSLQPFVDNIGTTLVWFYENILQPFGVWTISDVIPAFFNILSGVFEILNPILEVFMDLGAWLWDSFLQPIAQWTGGIIVDVLNGLADVLHNIGDWMKEHKEVIEAITIIIMSFAAAWGIVTTALKIYYGALNIYNAIVYVVTNATTIFGAAIAFITSPIGIAVAAIGAIIAIGVLLYKNWDTVKEKASQLGSAIMNIFGRVKDFLGNVFTGIVNGFVWVINKCIGGMNVLIEGLLSPLNALIGGWNATIGVVAGEIDPIEIRIPDIPYLARGGIVDNPTLAMVGERGKEAVMPLENNTGWINQLAGQLALSMPQQGNNFGDAPIEIILKIGDTTLGKYAADGINKLSRQKGRCVINV